MFYLLPLLADMLVAIMVFVAPVWSALQGASVRFTSLLGVVFAVGYVLTCVVLSRLATHHNARRILTVGLAGMGAVAGLGGLAQDYHWMMPMVGGLGIFAAMFFASFQVAMHSHQDVRPLGHSVAIYNVSWSTGAALGLLAGGAILEVSRFGVHLMAAGMAALALLFFWWHAAREANDNDKMPLPDEQPRPTDLRVQSEGRDYYVLLGWASILMQGIGIATVYYVFPKLGLERGFSPSQMGLADFLFIGAQVVATPVLLWTRRCLYGPWITVLAGGLGAAAFALMALSTSYGMNLTGLILLGVAGGINFFTSVYYANNYPRRAHAVGINEAAVGSGSIVGPGIGALFGGGATLSLGPYWTCLALFLLLALGALILHAAKRPDGIAEDRRLPEPS